MPPGATPRGGVSVPSLNLHYVSPTGDTNHGPSLVPRRVSGLYSLGRQVHKGAFPMPVDRASAVEEIAESDFPAFWANTWEQNLISPKWAARICGVCCAVECGTHCRALARNDEEPPPPKLGHYRGRREESVRRGREWTPPPPREHHRRTGRTVNPEGLRHDRSALKAMRQP